MNELYYVVKTSELLALSNKPNATTLIEEPVRQQPPQKRKKRRTLYGPKKKAKITPLPQINNISALAHRQIKSEDSILTIFVDLYGKKYNMVTQLAHMCSTFSYFTSERDMEEIVQNHQTITSPIPLSDDSISHVPIATKTVNVQTELNNGSISWIKFAISVHNLDENTCSGDETIIAPCGCMVTVISVITSHHTYQHKRVYNHRNCSHRQKNVDNVVSIDILSALLLAVQLAAASDTLTLLASAFIWHFVVSSNFRNTCAIDKYMDTTTNPSAIRSVEHLIEETLISSNIHNDCLACILLRDVGATARLAAQQINVDRHVKLWPVCDIHNSPSSRIPERASVASKNMMDRTLNIFKNNTMAWEELWANAIIVGESVMHDIVNGVWNITTFYIRCKDALVGEKLRLCCKHNNMTAPNQQIPVDKERTLYEFKTYKHSIEPINPNLNMIFITPHDIVFNGERSHEIDDIISPVCENAAIHVKCILRNPSTTSPIIDVDNCIYELRKIRNRFTFSPATGAINASLQAIVKVFPGSEVSPYFESNNPHQHGNPFFPALRSGHRLFQRPSPQKQIPSIHGYNVSLDDAQKSFGRQEKLYIDHGGKNPVYGFAWRGDFGATQFNLSVESSRLVGSGAFAKFIRDFKGHCPKTKINIVSHSLGAGVVLEALAHGAGVNGIGDVVLANAAVDNEVLEEGGEFASAPAHARKIEVVSDNNDLALNPIYPIGTFDRALGDTGPEHPGSVPANVVHNNMTDSGRSLNIGKSHGRLRDSAEFWEKYTPRLSCKRSIR